MSILYSENGHFSTLPLISPQLIMVERQTIPHMNALLNSSKILGKQLSSSFRGCHATFSLKSVFFTRKVAWSSLIELHGCSWDIFEPTSRPLKWGTICLCSISYSLKFTFYKILAHQTNTYGRQCSMSLLHVIQLKMNSSGLWHPISPPWNYRKILAKVCAVVIISLSIYKR